MGVNNKNNLPYFRFGLRGSWDAAVALLTYYPMKARTEKIEADQLAAVNALLSNIPNGNRIAIRNFSDLTRDDRGFSRKIFLDALNHFINSELIEREGGGYSKSVITYSYRIKKYIPNLIVFYPKNLIIINIKKEGRTVAKIDIEERREMKKRLSAYHEFIIHHEIDPGLKPLDFKVFNECETLIYNKPPLIEPKRTDILPVIIYKDRDLTMGGRMYHAFWIGMKKILRRGITIDGSKTCDIDGKGMHVQLLYRLAGEPLPEGEIYLHTDERRKITKGLMLLMMNTSTDVSPEVGRKQVKRTYKKRFGYDEWLDKYIDELEGFHHKILRLLYKPNWGRLQKTEAAIMLSIMEVAMNENILVLPVHDGCMCKVEHRVRVLELFAEQNVEAEENKDHLRPVPLAETKEFLAAFHKMKKCCIKKYTF